MTSLSSVKQTSTNGLIQIQENILEKPQKQIIIEINKEHNQLSTDVNLGGLHDSNVTDIQQMSSLSSAFEVAETLADIVDRASIPDLPVYFDPEEDEFIENKTYFTRSFYAIEE